MTVFLFQFSKLGAAVRFVKFLDKQDRAGSLDKTGTC